MDYPHPQPDDAGGDLSAGMLDASAGAPLYRQILDLLRDRVRSGHYPVGSILPGEQELSRLFGVSRITIKRALQDLAAGGYVSRQRGRGTTVTFDAAAPTVKGSFETLADSLKSMGLGTDVMLLSVELVQAPDDVAALLDLPEGASVQQAIRVRQIEGKPFSYLITWVPGGLAARFDASDLSRTPLLDLLAGIGHEAVEAEQWITATAALPEVAHALGISAGAPLLEIRRVMRDAQGLPVEVLHGYYRPDRFQHHMSLTKRRRGSRVEWH
jgi:GntR family transcriptional regulator